MRFKPILKDKIWGGTRLRDVLGKNASGKAGESWEISSYGEDISVVENGFLAGNNLQELVEVYMGDLVGEKIFDKFGALFPLLIKFIYASDFLSIQVHPDDTLAQERHNANGKTEMWYIVESENGELISGFNREMDQEQYLAHFREGTLKEILNHEQVSKGDIYNMPAGGVHAIGAGVLLAEIQQTSDLTYRIYDWGRVDDQGNSRELHTDLALDAIDFQFHPDYQTHYQTIKNSTVTAVDSPYFTTSVIQLDQPVEKDFNMIDSFVIYMCMEGEAGISYPGGVEKIKKGETILIPAELKNMAIVPSEPSTLLEIYIK
ncbi:MAG: class I mannose-6-phosphate isomerase [Pirellulales bacterium]|nr:class I mannose-6-phosphate isomerase [Pirellulales bacterium]